MAVKICLDTNMYTALAKNEPGALTLIQRSSHIYISFIALAELRAGFRSGTKGAQNEKILQRFLGSDRVEILFADEQTTHHYARIYHQLRKQGTPIPINDLWIAALVIQYDLLLCSRDTHFDHIPQVPRFVP